MTKIKVILGIVLASLLVPAIVVPAQATHVRVEGQHQYTFSQNTLLVSVMRPQCNSWPDDANDVFASLRDARPLGPRAQLVWSYTKVNAPGSPGAEALRLIFLNSSCQVLDSITVGAGNQTVNVPSGKRWVLVHGLGVGTNVTFSLRRLHIQPSETT